MPDFDNRKIGSRIQSARQKKGMSRKELADTVNISPQHLGNIENGDKGISLHKLCEVAKALNVTTDYILLGLAVSDYTHTYVAQALTGMTENERESARAIIDTIADLLKNYEQT